MSVDREPTWEERTAWAERLMERVCNPLEPLVCPYCDIRFGLDITDLRFFEQTEATFHCPRGHELRAGIT